MEKRLDFVAVDFETLQAAAHDGKLYHKLPIQIGMQRYIGGRPDGLPYRRFINPPVDTLGNPSARWESLGRTARARTLTMCFTPR